MVKQVVVLLQIICKRCVTAIEFICVNALFTPPHTTLVNMKVAIIGAGAIGCFVGVSLLRVGVDVTFVGRQSLLDDIKRTGRLHISDHNDEEFSVPADKVKFVVDLGELPRDFDFLLITGNARYLTCIET